MQLKLRFGAPFLLCLAVTTALACEKHAVAPTVAVSFSNCGKATTTRAFVHVSRHGMWASMDPGLNGKGFVITLAEAELNDAGVARLLKYSRDPRENGNNSFQATLSGKVACPSNGKAARMAVRRITNVRLAPIRDPK